MDADDFKLFFDRLRPQLTDPDLKPEWILNFNETNLVNNPGSSVAIVRRSEKKKAALMMKNGKEGWFVMFAGTASGRMLPPYVVFKCAVKIPTCPTEVDRASAPAALLLRCGVIRLVQEGSVRALV